MTTWIVNNLLPPALTLAFIIGVVAFVMWLATRDYDDSNNHPH